MVGILSNGAVVIRGEDGKYLPAATKPPRKREMSRRWQPLYRDAHQRFCDSDWQRPRRLIGYELRHEGIGDIPPPPVGFMREEWSVDLVAGSASRWRAVDRSKKLDHHLRAILASDGVFSRDLDRMISETCDHSDNPSHARYCRHCGAKV